jgi:ribonuclease HI/pterin-4a-carbinolamine dehydratase
MESMWQKTEKSLYQKFEFKDFDEAFSFVEKVAEIAREMDHHPKISNSYNMVELWLSTHSAGDKVTEKDESFATKIDTLFNPKKSTQKSELKQAKLYTDGGSRGNPGPSALGYVIMDMQDNVIKKDSFYLGITTNNQAEYQALKEGLLAVRKLGASEIEVYMDSLLVVNQMKGLYKVKNRDLWPIYQSIKDMLRDFSKVSFVHVPRALNSIADGMVNECLDSQKGK